MDHTINITTIEAMVLLGCIDGRIPQNKIDQALAEKVRRNIEDEIIKDLTKEGK